MAPDHDNTAPVARRTCKRYLPFGEVGEGMALGEPIALTERGILRFSLPAGHELTEGNLRQLAAFRAEVVCVSLPDMRTDEEVAAESAAAATQVMKIFEGADLTNPALAALFDRVLGYRSN